MLNQVESCGYAQGMNDTEWAEAAGYWWVVESPDIRVPGVVRLVGDGKYELTTIGSLGQSFEALQSLGEVTLFGDCGGDKYTLLGALLTNQTTRGMIASSTAETWMSFVMVRGTHLLPSSRFGVATFRLSGLSWLWGRWRHVPEGDPNENYEAGAILPAVHGCEVRIVRTRRRSVGLGRSSYRDHIAVHVEASEGLTLDDLDRRFIFPLRALTACVTGGESEVSHENLAGFLGENGDASQSGAATVEVNPWTSLETDEDYRPSLLKDNDPFFCEVVTRWLQISEKLLNPMVIAAPRTRRGYLEMETFAAVGAAEQVQRELTEGIPTPFADSLKITLAEHRQALGLSSDERRRIVNAVKMSEFTLQHRLKNLLGGDSESIFMWLFQEHLAEWAEVSAKVRNVLGHGLASPAGRPVAYLILIEVLDATRAVILIRLLIECGFPKDELELRLGNDTNWIWQRARARKWPEYLRSIGR